MEDGIDADVIFPARFLLRMEKEGLGGRLLFCRPYLEDKEDGAEASPSNAVR
jgi:3-isopropylmalate dehydratase small subunit